MFLALVVLPACVTVIAKVSASVTRRRQKNVWIKEKEELAKKFADVDNRNLFSIDALLTEQEMHLVMDVLGGRLEDWLAERVVSPQSAQYLKGNAR